MRADQRRRMVVLATFLVFLVSPVAGQDGSDEGPGSEVGDSLRDVFDELRGSFWDDLPVEWDQGLYWQLGRVQVQLGGRLHLDAASLEGGTEDEVRRARLGLRGRVSERVSFGFEYDLDGERVQSGYLEIAPVAGAFDLQLGRLRQPLGLEGSTSSNYGTFPERSSVDVLAPGYADGVLAYGRLRERRVTWELGIFENADERGPREAKTRLDFAGRLTHLPWRRHSGERLLHLGLNVGLRQPERGGLRLRHGPEVDLAEDLVDTGRFAADRVWLAGIEAALVQGPWSLQAEAATSRVATPDRGTLGFTAWSVETSWFATGEHRLYNRGRGRFLGVVPGRPWGALQLAARVSALDLDDGGIAGGRLETLTVGVNWVIAWNLRVMLHQVFADSTLEGREQVLVLRLQIHV